MSRSKKLFILSLLFCSLMGVTMLGFYHFVYSPKVQHFERVQSFLNRLDEHHRYRYELQMVQIEYDANKQLFDMYDDEIDHMVKLVNSFPSDDLIARMKELEQERDEVGVKVDYLHKRLELTKSYMEGLDKYLALSCVDFGLTQDEADRVMTDKMSREEAHRLLISKGVIK